VQLEAHYSAESFLVDDGEDLAYRGNLDLLLTLDTQALGAWPGGEILVYGQHGHGRGVSDDLGLLMPVSNLEAESFTQLSELWLEQRLGDRVRVRLGKQDANRDFANPRFPGNFVNSSYGVLPGAPLPSFPAPALGAALLVDATPWLGLRGGVYEGAPEVESFAGHAFDDGAGLFAVGALVLRHELFGRDSGVHSLGAWTHTASDRWGAFGVLDWRLFARPSDPDDERGVQLFLRGGWSPEREGEIGVYAGAGVTAHGFLGLDETFGLGAGHARTDTEHETFVELFVKLRPVPWFTVEPNLQLFDAESGRHAVLGLRLKLKL
jgi:porin